MNAGKIGMMVATMAVAIGILFAVKKFVLQQEFNLTESVIQIVVVIFVVAVAGYVIHKGTGKTASPEIKV